MILAMLADLVDWLRTLGDAPEPAHPWAGKTQSYPSPHPPVPGCTTGHCTPAYTRANPRFCDERGDAYPQCMRCVHCGRTLGVHRADDGACYSPGAADEHGPTHFAPAFEYGSSDKW